LDNGSFVCTRYTVLWIRAKAKVPLLSLASIDAGNCAAMDDCPYLAMFETVNVDIVRVEEDGGDLRAWGVRGDSGGGESKLLSTQGGIYTHLPASPANPRTDFVCPLLWCRIAGPTLNCRGFRRPSEVRHSLPMTKFKIQPAAPCGGVLILRPLLLPVCSAIVVVWPLSHCLIRHA